MDTVWLIVSGSMLIVIGSVFWILPSPADRQKMKLRQLAFQEGFQVHAMMSADVGKKFAIKHAVNPLYYYFRLGNFPGYTAKYGHFPDLVALPFEGGWQFYTSKNPENILTDLWSDSLPENLAGSVSCLYFSKKEVGMLWNEKADITETERRLASLSTLF